MERPKQQAIAFLLGALLVGGALGFSADRVFRSDELTPAQRRAAFYEDIGVLQYPTAAASATILTVIVSLLVVAILRTVDIRKELTQ